MNEKQIEAFEKWFHSDELSGYEFSNLSTVELMRKAWQAAIASVVITLPAVYGKKNNEFFDPCQVKESIEDAGVRYE